jgi:hypothetical protein
MSPRRPDACGFRRPADTQDPGRKPRCTRCMPSHVSQHLNVPFRPYHALNACNVRSLRYGFLPLPWVTSRVNPLQRDPSPRSGRAGRSKCSRVKLNSANLHNWFVRTAHDPCDVHSGSQHPVSLVRECPFDAPSEPGGCGTTPERQVKGSPRIRGRDYTPRKLSGRIGAGRAPG